MRGLSGLELCRGCVGCRLLWWCLPLWPLRWLLQWLLLLCV